MSAASPRSDRAAFLARYTHDQGPCRGEAAVVTTDCAREIFVSCGPGAAAGNPAMPAEQARQLYDCLTVILTQAGAEMRDVVLERVFCRDFNGDFARFAAQRRSAYRQAGVADAVLPLVSYLQQPPCRAAQAFELQAYAVRATSSELASVETIRVTPGDWAAKRVRIGPCCHLYARAIVGRGANGEIPGTFRGQSDAMFATAGGLLRHCGAAFTNVVRTWCYLSDIDRDYPVFNASRNAFFQRHGVQRLPASTGINAGLRPPGTLCSLDFDALLNPSEARIEVMHSPTLNEATEYDVAFSRGLKIVLPEKTLLVVSGTASVDQCGASVHVGDVTKQIRRMRLNIQELLAPHSGTFADVVQAITYLKSADHLKLFRTAWHEKDLDDVPNAIVQAHVCRPNLLCEMEVLAALPAATQESRAGGKP